jgi:hypothetical protein
MTSNVKDESIVGSIVKTNSSRVIRKWGEGAVPLNITKVFLGDIFNMIFGQVPTSSGPDGNGNYTHVWTLKDASNHLAYSIATKKPINGFKRFIQALLNDVSFEFPVDGIAKATLNMLSKGEDAGKVGVTSYDTTYEFPYFIPEELNVYFGPSNGDLASLEGIDRREVSNFTLNVQKNAKIDWGYGSTPKNISNTVFDAGMTIEETFENDDLKTWAETNVKKPMRIELIGSDDFKAQIDIAQVGFETWEEKDVAKDGIVKVGVGIFLEMDTDEEPIKATLINKKAGSYYGAI